MTTEFLTHFQAPRPRELTLPLRLQWRRQSPMPNAMHSAQSIELQGKIYLGGGLTRVIHGSEEYKVDVYDPMEQVWSKLPNYETRRFRMAVINNQLTLVGGMHRDGTVSNDIRAWDQRTNLWAVHYPPMPTARMCPSVVTYGKWLVVAGGFYDDKNSTDKVEILDTSTSCWYSAPPLPQHCGSMTSALLGDTWYLLGGFKLGFLGRKPIKCMFSVNLPTLIDQATQPSRLPPTFRARSPWQRLADPPLMHSCALAFLAYGLVLAFGGMDDNDKSRGDIHLYLPAASAKWVKAGDLPTAVCNCTSIVLPKGGFLVLGGKYINMDDSFSNGVYTATLYT